MTHAELTKTLRKSFGFESTVKELSKFDAENGTELLDKILPIMIREGKLSDQRKELFKEARRGYEFYRKIDRIQQTLEELHESIFRIIRQNAPDYEAPTMAKVADTSYTATREPMELTSSQWDFKLYAFKRQARADEIYACVQEVFG